MEMNKPTLVATIVLVFVVGLVFGSFSGLSNVATGEATRTGASTCRIYIDQRSATLGDTITVTAIPGKNGCKTPISLYDVGSQGQLGTRIQDWQSFPCNGINCKQQETFDIRVAGSWTPGQYRLCAKDGVTGQQQCSSLEVY